MTAIGQLRHRVDLEYATGASDDGGGMEQVWLPKATLWASIEPTSGREAVIAGRLSSEVTHTVTIRYRQDIKPADRFRLTQPDKPARTFEIGAIVNVNERNRWLRCFCEERDL